jgi:hypothetical protein
VNPPIATSPLSFGEVALPLHDRGWRPLPTNSKAPALVGWAQLCNMPWDRADLADAASEYTDCGCGIAASRDLVFVDCDILDPALAAETATIADSIFRPTPLIRIGRTPKWVRVYRYEPGSAIRSRKAHHPIEVMCGSGMVVGFGIHPDTGEPYRWVGAHSPLTLSADDPSIPLINGKQLDQFLGAAHAIITRSHYGVGAGAPGSRRHPARPPADIHQQLRQRALHVGFERAVIQLLQGVVEGNRHMTMWAVVSSAAGRSYPEGRLVALFDAYFAGWGGVSREALQRAIDQTYRREITDV